MCPAAENRRMRSKQDIRSIVEDFSKSGMTRREYCEKRKLSVTTLDYWRRAQKSKPRLVEIAVETQPDTGFVLVLANDVPRTTFHCQSHLRNF
jgi:hypothetical protein